MAFVHGKNTVILFNGTDISQFCNNTDEEDTTTAHDVTCYGAARMAYAMGLGDGKFTLKGWHNNSANNPRDVIKPVKAAGTLVTFVFRPEGTGTGKAQSSVSVGVTSYKQSAPVAEMVSWEAEFQMSGDLTETDQS